MKHDVMIAPGHSGSNLTAGRTRGEALRSLIIFSLSVTAACGVLAYGIHLVTDVRFMLTFVYLRWMVVLALLVTPVLHQLFGARMDVQLPYPLRTPLTALLLTCESIIIDIVSAQLH